MNCKLIADIARQQGVKVIHIWTVYRDDRKDWPQSWAAYDDTWCKCLVRGTESSRIVVGIEPKEGDVLIEKKRFSAFYNTNLDDVLRACDVGELDIIGYSSDVCIRFTSVDAYNRGYRVNIVREGVEAFRETTEQSLHYLQWTIDAKIVSIEEYSLRPLVG
jgi:nicotinamidase-related amidase